MKGYPRGNSRAIPLAAPIVKKRIKVTDLALVVANGSSAPGIGTAVIGAFPEGNILLLGALAQLKFDATGDTDASATWNGDYAIGTAPNADADLSDATDIDVVQSTAVGPAVARVSPVTRGTSATAGSGNIVDNTDGSLELNLNVMVDDADQTAAVSLTVNGFVDLAYIVLGDD